MSTQARPFMNDTITPLRFFGNLAVGAASVVGSLTLPELAAALSGFGGFAWFMVQIYIALAKHRCVKANCPNRQDK